MTSNVAYERSFAELSNGHGFSMVRVITLAKIIKTICSVFFLLPLKVRLLQLSSKMVTKMKVGNPVLGKLISEREAEVIQLVRASTSKDQKVIYRSHRSPLDVILPAQRPPNLPPSPTQNHLWLILFIILTPRHNDNCLISLLVTFLARSPQLKYYLNRLRWVRICGGEARRETTTTSAYQLLTT